MPIAGHGWEMLIERHRNQQRASDGKIRTVGKYRIFHDGADSGIAGMTAESRGPGTNTIKGRRIAPGRYALWAQDGGKYATIGHTSNANPSALRRPSVELKGTQPRSEILIHPGIGFLASVGCINLCKNLPNAAEPISFPGSRQRVIAMLDDLKAYLGPSFPDRDGKPIPRAFVVIEGEP
jgi:hypothetical protein